MEQLDLAKPEHWQQCNLMLLGEREPEGHLIVSLVQGRQKRIVDMSVII